MNMKSEWKLYLIQEGGEGIWSALRRLKSVAGKVVYAALTLFFSGLSTSVFASGEEAPATVNPLATTDQTEVTVRALRILQTPEVKKARDLVVLRFRAVLHEDPPPEAWESFESAIDEYTFNYVLKAANSDPNYPKIVHVYTPPHGWHGMKVPGSRWSGDNPDNVYRIIPIDGKARYRLDGRQFGNGPTHASYTLVGDYETSKTLNGIENNDVKINPDGTFSITLDPGPANGRPNHIQTKPDSLYLFIRHSLGDWRQRANALTIHRLDPPEAPPLTDQQIAERAAKIMVDGVAQVYYFWKLALGTPNAKPELIRIGMMGGLVTQLNYNGMIRLADDEAMVYTLNPGGAGYFSFVAHNYWIVSGDYWRNTASLNQSQVVANRDGTITYVVSIRDPGVLNWVDSGGLHDVPVIVRLQRLPDKPPTEPWIKSQLVKLADLRKVLPQETRWVTPEERVQQRKERLAAYQARMADH